MEKIKDEEKNKKYTSAIKNKMFKGHEQVRNKININLDLNKNFVKFSYDNDYIFEKINSKSNEKKNQKEDKLLTNNINNRNNLDIKHFSKTKKDDYNNILNRLFFTTSNIIKNQKYFKNKYSNINLNNFNNKDFQNENDKNKILNKLFPDIDEINKYSNLPFFYLTKAKIPYKMKVNSNHKQEEFLYKISHNHNDEEKINFNFIKNKGIKKGRTAKYFHGVDKFCINNKISETNFYKEDELSKKNLKLKLDISNLTKGEIIPQISTKEKHIKILQNNLKNIKSLPNQLFNDIEDGVFKFIDEEFDKKNNEDSIKNIKNEEIKKKISDEANKNTLTNNSKIINLSTQFQMNKKYANKYLQTENDYQDFSKNKSYYNNRNSINYNYSGFKKPQQYPINFYSTQQLKKKEHFTNTHKNTYEERNKKLKKENHSGRIAKKYLSEEVIKNINELQRKKIINNKYAYKKESKTRDIIIGNKLKCEFNSEDIKRILNGLKPYADVQEINIDFDNIKINEINKK